MLQVSEFGTGPLANWWTSDPNVFVAAGDPVIWC
jgi:hypothetical protein